MYAQSVWTFDAPAADDPREGSAHDSLERLAGLLRGKGAALAGLRDEYETQITYSGFSDSEQAGFVFSAGLLAQLAELGCDLLGTAYLEDPEEEAPESPGVVEHVVLPVIPGREAEFESAFAEARVIVAASPGFRRLSLSRGIETPNEYLLLIEWDTLEAHQVGFRGSPAYGRWRALLHQFYDPFPDVTHFAPTGG